MKRGKSPRPRAVRPDEKAVSCEARERLLQAAERLFAERGRASVNIRDLVSEAKVNIAAVNYYFGGKDNLYLETLRYSYRNSRESLPKLEALLRDAKTEGTAAAAQRAITLFIEEFMRQIFISNKTSHKTALMGKELSHPTSALDIIVDEFVSPVFQMLVALVEQARPDLAVGKESHLAAMSILGQCLNYSLALPVTLKLLKRSQMTPSFVAKLAGQISEFSLNALSRNGREATRKSK
jgi:AcrR family transcriptional regulator